MPFPRKFKSLLETTLRDVDPPDYVFLTYAVCACEHDSCGWGGWILEGAFKSELSGDAGERLLPGYYGQRCPQCGRATFRTEATIELRLAGDQSRVEIGTDNTAPVEYEE